MAEISGDTSAFSPDTFLSQGNQTPNLLPACLGGKKRLDPGAGHPLNDKIPGEQETHPSKAGSSSLNEEKQTNRSRLYPEQEDAGVKSWAGDFPGGPVVKNLPSKAGMWVCSLAGELRSHTPHSN